MRTFLTLLFMCCFFLPLNAFCGPSVGGGDGSIVEEGQVPEYACAAAGGVMVEDKADRLPDGGDQLNLPTGNVDAARRYEACTSPSAGI